MVETQWDALIWPECIWRDNLIFESRGVPFLKQILKFFSSLKTLVIFRISKYIVSLWPTDPEFSWCAQRHVHRVCGMRQRTIPIHRYLVYQLVFFLILTQKSIIFDIQAFGILHADMQLYAVASKMFLPGGGDPPGKDSSVRNTFFHSHIVSLLVLYCFIFC